MNQDFFKEKLQYSVEQLNIYHHKSNVLSTLRFICFLVFLFSLTMILWTNYFIIIAVVLISLFVFLVIYHNKISIQEQYYKLKIDTLTEYLYRLDQGWFSFPEDGKAIDIEKEPFLLDLDIIGEASLYKYLNICKTKNAKIKLIKRLSNPKLSKEDLLIKQISMQEISSNIDFSIDFQIELKRNKDDIINLNHKSKTLTETIEFNKVNLYFMFMFGSFTFLSILYGVISGLFEYFIFFFFIQLIYSSFFNFKYRKTFNKIANVSSSISAIENVYKVIDDQKFENPQLKAYQSLIYNHGLLGIRSLNYIHSLDSLRLNFITNVIFNGLCSINIIIIALYKRYQLRHGSKFNSSVEALEELEVLTSLAILGQTKKVLCLPQVIEGCELDFKNLKHPLLNEDECVANDYHKQHNINIITGSNMSGKTSFLRTLGINMILMNAGAFVNADVFNSGYFKIFTSMRITDNLSKGISTFYAELLRIKAAIEYSKTSNPMIVFIDEVFKGTNSNDRIQGAISLVERLRNNHTIVFITTHDFEICDIKNVVNYHFSEYYQENKIKFNYKLQHGKCNTTNARYLMKLAGIID